MKWNIDPVLLDLGFLELRYYGILFATGIYFAYYLAVKFYEKDGISQKIADNLLVVEIICIIILAHLAHLIFYHPSAFTEDPMAILRVGQGLASHGGVTGALLGVYIISRREKIAYFRLTDPIAVGAGITGMCIRLGNFFNSEIYGKPTDLPWGIVFVRTASPEARHPTQLYEAGVLLLLFVLMIFMYRKYKDQVRPGFFTFLMITLYFTARFLIEFVKDVPSDLLEADSLLSMGQILSIPLVLIGATFVYLFRNKKQV